MMAATVMEWITAKLLERLHCRKWWDYSGKKFNLNGYLKLMKNCLDCEQNESCREMILESSTVCPPACRARGHHPPLFPDLFL